MIMIGLRLIGDVGAGPAEDAELVGEAEVDEGQGKGAGAGGPGRGGGEEEVADEVGGGGVGGRVDAEPVEGVGVRDVGP